MFQIAKTAVVREIIRVIISASDMSNEWCRCRLPSSGSIWCFSISFENSLQKSPATQ
ncbi:MAG: hypothetical protein LBL90_03805 [Prevotellaceae bacterium]|nr:hypothetical protein [Prevotellaceae bacterium]